MKLSQSTGATRVTARKADRAGDTAGSGRVIVGHVARRARRGAIIWGTVFGMFVLSTAEAFIKGYPTRAERIQLARSLQGFALLLGLPRHADTVAGFASWRVLTAVALIGAIWGLLTSTSLLRGEEEAGRWDLLLAGPVSRRGATARALLGLGAALGMLFLPTALLTLAVGRLPGTRFPVGGSLLFAVALVCGAAMFLAVGALTSQLSATRGQAVTLGAALLGATYITRMVADSRTSLGWLRWLTPLGWLEELRPLTGPQPLALVPILGLVLACSGGAVFLAGRRDVGASILPDGGILPKDARWVVGPLSLAVRLSTASGLAWMGGIGALSALEGALARSTTSVLSQSPTIIAALGRLGVRREAEAFLGIAFFFVAVALAVFSAGQVVALREEEASGRLENLLVQPLRRITWLASRLGVALTLLLLTGLGAGLCAWLGLESQHLRLALPTLLAAGLNATVPGVVVLGAGALVFGVHPRLSAAASYGVVAWSFLADLVGSFVRGSTLVRDSSLFTHLALAPAAKPDWGTAAVLVLLGFGAAIVGAVAFRRRDVQYG